MAVAERSDRWRVNNMTHTPRRGGAMRIEPVFLPEFGVAVSWAMCRNPMCANFRGSL